MTFTVNIEPVQACLRSLGLRNLVDAQAFYNELEQQAAKFDIVQTILLPPPLTPFRWTAVLPPERVQLEPPPSVTSFRAPALSPEKSRQRRFMIEETSAMLNCQAERFKPAPMMSPLLYYDQLRFICFSSITVFSSNREHSQVFKDSWCTWDFNAPHLCILASDENVKGGTDGPAPLPMNLLMWGSSTTIDSTVTIHPAFQMPQQTTCFIFGRKLADLLQEHPVVPVAFDGESHT